MKEKQKSSIQSNKLELYLAEGRKSVEISNEESNLLISIPRQLKLKITHICVQLGFPIKDIVPVGSSQRKTFLPGSRDIDIFVRFDTKERSYLVEFAENAIPLIAKQLKCNYTIKYAENPFGILHYSIDDKKIIDIDVVATIFIQDTKELIKI